MRSFNLLIAEDDANDCRYLELLLARTGLTRMAFVDTGDAVIDYLEGRGDYGDRQKYPYPDILLLDLLMPKMTGAEVLAWIAAQPGLRLPSIYVVSGTADSETQASLATRPIRKFFQKPVTLSQVTWMLEDHLSSHPSPTTRR